MIHLTSLRLLSICFYPTYMYKCQSEVAQCTDHVTDAQMVWKGRKRKENERKEKMKEKEISVIAPLHQMCPAEHRNESTGRLTPQTLFHFLFMVSCVCVCVCRGVSRSDHPLHLSFPSAWASRSPQTQNRHLVRYYLFQTLWGWRPQGRLSLAQLTVV